MIKLPLTLLSLLLIFSCSNESTNDSPVEECSYLDYSNRHDQQTGGIRMVPIETPKGTFNVWTKRVGNNPTMKVLLLHGGPGGTHEFFECFDGYLPKAGIEYIYYDQLDSYYSDQPNDSTHWTIEHFVEEVEQVRQALNLDKANFYLYGQSWGGILAMEYALKYQQHLKGLIISNMMSDIDEYARFAQEVLGPKLPSDVFEKIMTFEAEEDFSNPEYIELVTEHYYTRHILRKPLDEWPNSVNRAFEHLNPNIYIYMQGYSEFGITGNASLKSWTVSERLNELTVPTLVIAGKYDTMDPDYLKWMSEQLPNGFLVTTNGSHLSQYDDPETFFSGLIQFIKDVDLKSTQ